MTDHSISGSTISRAISSFASRLELADIPASVVETGRLAITDTLACMLAGSVEEPVRKLAHRFSSDAGRSSIIGTSIRSSPWLASLVNGISATWPDWDRGHPHPSSRPPVPGVHPPIHLLPPLLALGQSARMPGQEFLRAFIIGHEITSRLGIATRLQNGLHGHGAQPVIGAALVAALAKDKRGWQRQRT